MSSISDAEWRSKLGAEASDNEARVTGKFWFIGIAMTVFFGAVRLLAEEESFSFLRDMPAETRETVLELVVYLLLLYIFWSSFHAFILLAMAKVIRVKLFFKLRNPSISLNLLIISVVGTLCGVFYTIAGIVYLAYSLPFD